MLGMKDHPFAVSAHFVRSTVLTYALPLAVLAPLLPPPLSLDTFEGEHAFVAVAMVETKALRPQGFPAALGNDFFLIGYRVFVRYTDQRGKRLRGLYILRSETNRWRMTWLGLSSIVTTRSAWRRSTRPFKAGARASRGVSSASSPCRIKRASGNWAADSTRPATTAAGPRSPPIASMEITVEEDTARPATVSAGMMLPFGMVQVRGGRAAYAASSSMSTAAVATTSRAS